MKRSPRNYKCKFKHIITKSGRRATVAYTIDVDKSTVVLNAGISYCSPKDQYRKFYGRDKSYGRLKQLLYARDGWALQRAEPEKYVHITLTIADGDAEKLVAQCHNMLDVTVEGFLPTAEAYREWNPAFGLQAQVA